MRLAFAFARRPATISAIHRRKVLIYPARYDRVIAVCGVMADGRPYTGLTGNALQGASVLTLP